MYVPKAFAQNDRTAIFDLMRAHSFALLISQLDGRPFASHLPLLVDEQAPPLGQLTAHVARENPQWQQLDGQEVLTIFSGPHAYVSPTWYEGENVVPTWNYLAVHAYGRCQLLADGPELARLLADSVATYERAMPAPWTLDSESGFLHQLRRGIVGLRIAITRLEGKWKLGQNQPAERREKVAARLAATDGADAQTIARLMLETLPR